MSSLPTIWLTRFLNFCRFAEILSFAAFYLIFGARKKKVSASGIIIPWQDALFLPDF